MAGTPDRKTILELTGDLAGCDALLIAGPTASGKSALAIRVAQETGGAVVNADSMQVYDGIRILTARPNALEESQADHRLYGFVDPRTAFSAGDYLRTVAPVLTALREEGRLAVIVGGTGLYFNALTRGLVQTPDIPAEVMTEVEAMQGRGMDLHQWLGREDPESAARLAPADVPRLQRAVAVKLATGRTLGYWQSSATSPALAAARWKGLFIAPERQALYTRINDRFRAMVHEGAIDEARNIAALGLPPNRGVMKAHGMPHLLEYLAGRLSLEDAIRLGQQDTRNYAKRQFTWARRFMGDWQRIPV